MINFKEKSKSFLLGMMTGLIVAGGFFILKLDDYFNELKIYKSTYNSLKNHFEASEKIANIDEQEDDRKVEVRQYKVVPRANYNLAVDSVKTNSLESKDYERLDSLNDAATSDSTAINYEEVSEEIVVRKDELISNSRIEIDNLDQDSIAVNDMDSLLQKVSGIRDDEDNSNMIEIELWQSPLNYKGYKLSKNKLIVYGIQTIDDAKIFKLDEELYLKIFRTVYNLESSNDFSPYKITKDESILNRLD